MRDFRSIPTAILVVVLFVVLFVAVGRADDDFERRAVRVAFELGSTEAAEREAAVRAFAELGVRAIEPALRALADPEEGTPGFDAVLEALTAIGLDRSAATLQSLQSKWPAGADELMAALRQRRAEALASLVTFEAAALADPHLVPPSLEVVLADGPIALPGAPAVRIERNAIRVDEKGDGRFGRRVGAKGDVVVGPTGTPFLVYHDLDRWCAAPARLWRGSIDKTTVEILDVDADGKLTAQTDWVRWGDGAFLPFRDGDLIQVKKRLLRYRATSGDEGPVLQVVPEPDPIDLDPRFRRVLAGLNDWRRRTGLGALYWDVARSRACQAHCRYWGLNGYTAHEEDASKPGYTVEGARAGRYGSCPAKADIDAILTLHYMVLHRVTPMGDGENGLGVGVDPGLCVWVDWPSARSLGVPILVPAPGQTDVPHTGFPEDPPPTRDPDFYDKKRGYAISVERSGLPVLSDVRLSLFRMDRKPVAVSGELFSREKPYREHSNTTLTHFVPDGPLGRGRHVAKFEGIKRNGETVTLVWSFEVGGR